ncbi:MAG: ferrous iron transport protein B [Sporomusaceae bacterium]|nr:ferrous iron transport protein B [Sporomusaceae bacterium]
MRQPMTIMLIGSPNVGKSMIFNQLTGLYTTVSNYPGTTVDVSRGKLLLESGVYEVVDTPGIYSLSPLTDEEKVTRALLCDGRPKLLVQVIDAKHIRRMGQLTLALRDSQLPMIVVLNMIDEAERLGMEINAVRLSEQLGIPVIKTSAVSGRGISELRLAIGQQCIGGAPVLPPEPEFSQWLEDSIIAIGRCIGDSAAYCLPTRLIALLLLQDDQLIWSQARRESKFGEIARLVNRIKRQFPRQLAAVIMEQRQESLERLLAGCISRREKSSFSVSMFTDKLTREPLTGIPVLFFVLYVGLYLFVGRFGAGVAVDYINTIIFGNYLLPVFNSWLQDIPFAPLQTLLGGEFGIVSLGLRYAVGIILPVVGSFFLAFALLEDSGYLPRLAMLLNTVCRLFGLNGRGIIPLALGFGCGTMAVMVTRTLETKRERFLATLLLALAIPCSAQLGVILALLSGNPMTLFIWLLTITGVFFSAGILANYLLPGRQSPFYLELPPIRLPRPGNVIVKAYSRVWWYMKEIIPVFICVSLILWLSDRLGYLQLLVASISPWLGLMGLPPELAPVFLLGFFRRDYGAAGLYNAAAAGLLNPKQLLVAAVALTLFLPCIAQMAVMIKERGWLTALLLLIFIALTAFCVAFVVSLTVQPAWLE